MVERNDEMIIIDKGSDIPIYSPICLLCKHFNGNAFVRENKRTCKAFADIPLEIWKGENTHEKPYKGDGGVIFERR